MQNHSSQSIPQPPAWQRKVLLIAALYNILWGAQAVLFPLWSFKAAGMASPLYPELWQCIGMIVGVYGVGYAAAAFNPWRHWPIVLVGLLGKVFGPIGFIYAILKGSFTLAFGWHIVFNDVIWWLPFFLILRDTYHHWHHETQQARGALPDFASWLASTTPDSPQGTHSLAQLSQQSALLLVLVRHAGCTFCRETLANLAEALPALERAGLLPVVIHMGSPAEGEAMLATYQLQHLPCLSDVDRTAYRLLGLKRGRLAQLFGLNVWVRGFKAGVAKGHGVGALVGDGFQLSGYALVAKGGRLVGSHAHADAAERTPFAAIAQQWQGAPNT